MQKENKIKHIKHLPTIYKIRYQTAISINLYTKQVLFRYYTNNSLDLHISEQKKTIMNPDLKRNNKIKKEIKNNDLQRRIEAEIYENGRHERAHRAHRTDRSECPCDSPKAGSRRCGVRRGSMAAYYGSSAPSPDCSSSRISSASL